MDKLSTHIKDVFKLKVSFEISEDTLYLMYDDSNGSFCSKKNLFVVIYKKVTAKP